MMRTKIVMWAREIIWLVVSILIVLISIQNTIKLGFQKSLMFYLLAIGSIGMYLFRRYYRLHQKNNDQTS